MGDKEGISHGVAVRGNESSEGFQGVLRFDNSDHLTPSTWPPTAAATAATVAPPGPSAGTEVKKKKMGRPRKYNPDGTLRTALSPMPISASIPLNGELPSWKPSRGKSANAATKSSYEYETAGFNYVQGDRISYFVGTNFTPHVLTVNAGEDVTMKVMLFAQQGSQAVCILSANGTISNVTLRQPTSYGGTLTYEGCFEILSLTGSFMPTENGETKSRSGGMSISLAGPDGRVVGGGLAGLLIAAGPVQVVVGSFLVGHQQESNQKKQRTELPPIINPPTANAVHGEEMRVSYGVVQPVLTSSASFQGHGNYSSSLNPVLDYRHSAENNHSSSPGEDSRGQSLSQYEVSVSG